MRQPVFVYGTLKRGEGNHHWLGGATRLGRRRLAGVHLHDLGPYPKAVRAEAASSAPPDPATCLHGELYLVDDCGLARLDRLEDMTAKEFVDDLLCSGVDYQTAILRSNARARSVRALKEKLGQHLVEG